MDCNTAMDSTLNQAVRCPACKVLLDECITFIQCKHITCCACATTAKERNNGQPVCPVCNSQVSSKEILFTNPLMKAVLSLTQNGFQKEDAIQGHCGKACLQCGSEQSGFRCIQCDTSLCEGCRHRHLLIPSCKDHITEQLFETGPHQQEKIKVDANCLKHPSKVVEMNCITCNIAICSQCKFEDHDTHNSESLDCALQKCLPQVTSACDDIGRKVAEKQQKILQLEDQSKALLKNRTKTKSQIEAHKEKIILALLAPIHKAHDNLCQEIDAVIEAELNAVTTLKDQLKSESRNEGSISNWAEVVSAFTDGGALLNELQSGLMLRLTEIIKCQAQETPDIKQIRLMQFKPSLLEIPAISLGEVSEAKHNVSPIIQRAQSEVDIHFRKPNTNLCKLPTIIGRVEKTVKVNTASNRMCLFGEKLWIPSATTNTLNVFPLEGDGESVETILDLGKVIRPQSLHPINPQLMALASDSGLFSVDVHGHIMSLIKAGKFADVFVEDKVLWALEIDEKRIYSWSVLNLSRVQSSFPVQTGDQNTLNTLCTHRSSLYICSYDNNVIHKYDLEGNLKKSFGVSGSREPGELIEPILCATDGQGDILVADCGNHRLQLLSCSGKWSVVPMKVFKPRDVILVRSTMYVLHSEGNKISIYPL